MYAKTFITSLVFLFLIGKKEEVETITLPEIVVTPLKEKVEKKIDLRERNYLARIVYAEGSVSKKDYPAIAHVVMVRAKYKNKSVIQVITAKGQFDAYKSKKWFQPPPREAYIAAELALLGELWDIYPANMYYFHNPKTATDSKWVKYISKYTLGMIGDHEFCYNKKM